MTDARTRARELLAAATPGSWYWDDAARAFVDSTREPVALAAPVGYENSEIVIGDADAALIAAAPELLTALCDELDRAKAQVARLRDFANYVVSVRQPPSMSAADIVQDYEDRARAALAGTEESER